MVLLITIYENKMFFEDLGINRIAAYLKEKDIKVHVRPILLGTEISACLLKEISQYKYVGFSVYDNNIDYIEQLALAIKKRNKEITIFYGSQYISIAYKNILDMSIQADFLVLGDGEYPLYDFIKNNQGDNKEVLIKESQHLVSKEWVGLKHKKPCSIDINELPWPIHSKDFTKQSMHIDLNTSSGCVGDCTFCGSIRRKWSGRHPESIYKEIMSIIQDYNLRSFLFADSSFEDPGTYGKQRIAQLLDLLATSTEPHSFSANIRAESFKNNRADIALLQKMRNVGFSQLFIGIESGNEKDLTLYNKRAKIDDNIQVLQLLKNINIEPFWGFIMYNPYSTLERLYDNYIFLSNNDTYITYHYISYLTLYNGTKIYDIAKKDGLIVKDGNSNIEYRINDKQGRELFLYIKENFLDKPILQYIKNTRDMMHFYQYMKPLVDDSKEYDQVNEIKKCLARANKEYFKYLYEDIDYMQANHHLLEFQNEIIRCHECMMRVKVSILKSYYKTYGV